ncbi:hypothetical protein GCM10028790_47840 [Micromonospora taraxaci]|uniref:ABC-2 family transporter n=1 Tax=Micromonospora taraxaci TaxID=1316803 RepID=A0A561VF10_9ACTN|nr:hypothetical protein [Micromonospora taraxaci]TWG10178.1 hypothetical protein FHU34_12632 [Micromonospora taraxaci]
MRWLQLYLRSRRVPLALGVAIAVIVLAWVMSSTYTTSTTINARTASLTIMLAVVALGATLNGADDALDHTASVNWPLRRAGHLLIAAAVITALLSLSALTDVRYEPLALVLRNTAGLLGLTALGTAVFGAALSWIAPLTWTLIAVLPFLGPSADVRVQVASWLTQPAGTTAATVCATVLAVTGLLAYALRGGPLRPASETAPDR